MARQSTILRLPVPPVLNSKFDPELARQLNEHLNTMTTILNQALQGTQNRLATVQQTGAIAPPIVSNFTATGKQGLFHLTWNRIKNADGYVIMHASDMGMKNVIGRYHVPDGQSVSHQIPVGNVATTGYFQMYAYQGPQYSKPSAVVSATTSVYGSAEAAPVTSKTAPQNPLVSPVRSGPNLP